MSKFGNCVVCDSWFHYSETSELTVSFDMAAMAHPDHARRDFWAPPICMSCEALIQNA